MLALDAEPNAIGGTVTVAQAAEAAGRLNMATGSMPLIYINRYGPDQRGNRPSEQRFVAVPVVVARLQLAAGLSARLVEMGAVAAHRRERRFRCGTGSGYRPMRPQPICRHDRRSHRLVEKSPALILPGARDLDP